ncbi:hypothetical protein BIV59_19885 [Bacillus sp. MUM 13]|nr:hypothetical protein BIV59_19885 [Bacillus sp. MUM 13]
MKRTPIKDKFYRGIIAISALYLLIRIFMTILTTKYDIVLYSKALNINLTHFAWFMDIGISLSASFALFFYCKSTIPSFFYFLIMLISIVKLFPLFAFSSDYSSIDNSMTNSNYIISKHQSDGVNDGNRYLSVFVYKNTEFPLLFKRQGRYSKFVLSSSETFINFSNNNYSISKDGNFLSYGDFNIPLK